MANKAFKRNCEEQFKILFEKLGFKDSSYKEFLYELYDKHYKETLEGEERNFFKWSEGFRPTLSKCLRGEQGFSAELIYATGLVCDFPFYKILELCREDDKVREDGEEEEFEDISIRRAVFYDDAVMLRKLFHPKDGDEYGNRRVACNNDEFGKGLLDYMIEKYERRGICYVKNTLNFFVRYYSESSYHCYAEFINRGIRGGEEEGKCLKLWNMLLELDDGELFLEYLGEREKYGFYPGEDEDGKHTLMKCFADIGRTQNIFSALIRTDYTAESGETSIPCPPPMLERMLWAAAGLGDTELKARLLDAYRQYTDKLVERFKPILGGRDEHFQFCIENGKTISRSDTNEAIFKLLPLGEYPMNRWEGLTAEDCEGLLVGDVVNRIRNITFADLEYGARWIDKAEGVIYSKLKLEDRPQRFAFCQQMWKRQVYCVPRVEVPEDGCDDICKEELFDESKSLKYRDYADCSEELGMALGAIHRASQEILGEGRVYLHGPGFLGCCYSDRDRKPWDNDKAEIERIKYTEDIRKYLFVIGGWKKETAVGEPIDDIIDAIIEVSGASVIDSDASEALSRIRDIVKGYCVYGMPEVISGLGDRLMQGVDERLKTARRTRRYDEEYCEYRRLYFARCFFDMYRENLNGVRCDDR